MTNGKVTVNIEQLQQQIVGELQRALGEEAELERMLAQKRTEIAARRGQLDLLAHLAQPQPSETEPLPERTPRGKPKE
jgi:hypothetical protein